MPATKSVKSKTSATKAKTAKTEAVQEDAPQEVTPVVEQVVETTEATHDESSVAATEESSLAADAARLIEDAKTCQNYLLKFLKGSRALSQNIRKTERQLRRLDKRLSAKKARGGSSGNKGLQTLKPVFSQEMKSFIEKHHNLEDRKGNVIYEQLQYDSTNQLLASRDHVLKLVTSYVRVNELQKYENKKRIMMDSELTTLFPTLAERKDKSGKVVQEENCYYHTLMKAFSRHFKSAEELAELDAQEGTSASAHASPAKPKAKAKVAKK
jgi:hypothetical protein